MANEAELAFVATMRDEASRVAKQARAAIDGATGTTKPIETELKVRDTATRVLDSVQSKLDETGRRMQEVGGKMTRGLTLPIVGLGVAIGKSSVDFSRGMGDVASLLPGNTQRIEELRDVVLDLGPATGASLGDLSKGLYQTLSAFGDTADTAKILELNAKGARAGAASVADAINLTSAVTKAYGDTSAKAVRQSSDLALMTVRLGQTTFPDLASSIGSVTPLTSALGVSQKELFATMATFTGVTGGASEVSTQLRGALQALMAPTADAAKAIKAGGFESGEALVKERGLAGAIGFLTAAAEKSGKPLQSYIGSIEGQTIALGLAGAQGDDYRAKLKQMGDAAGATGAAFKSSTTGVGEAAFTWDQAKAQAQAIAVQLGDGLAPAVSDLLAASKPLVKQVVGWATAFANADPKTQKMVAAAIALVAALGPIAYVGGTVVRTFGLIAGGAKGAVAAVRGVGSAAGYLKTAGSGGNALGSALDSVRLRGMMAGDALRKGAAGAKTWAAAQSAAAAASLRSAATTAKDLAVKAAHAVASKVAAAATKAWAAVQWILNAAMSANPLVLVVIAIVALVVALVLAWKKSETFRAIVLGAWEAIKSGVSSAINAVKSALVAVWGAIGGIVKAYVNVWRTIITTAWRVISTVVRAAVGVVKSVISTGFKVIATVVRTYVAIWRAIITTAWKVISTVVRAAVNVVRAVISTAFKVIATVVRTYVNMWRTIITTAWNVIKAVVSTAVKVLRTVVVGGFNAIKSAISTALNAAKNLVTNAWNAIKGAFERGVTAAVSKAKELGGKVVSSISGFVGDMTQVGRDLISGMIQGVGEMAGALVGKVKDVVGGAKDAAKSLLGISSPSKVFREIGMWTVKGFVKGLDGGRKSVDEALDKLFGGIRKVYDERFKSDKRARRAAAGAIKDLRDETRALRENATARDKIVSRLKVMREAVGSLRDSIREATDVSSIETVNDAPLTAGFVLSGLQDRLDQIRAFQDNLDAMRRAGFSNDTIRDLMAQGWEEGGAAAAALAQATGEQVKAIERANRRIEKEAQEAGGATARGMIRGIERELKAVDRIGRRLAQALRKAVRRELGIRSPSARLAEDGQNTARGLAAGILAGVPDAESAARDMARRVSAAATLTLPDLAQLADAAAIRSYGVIRSSETITIRHEVVSPDGSVSDMTADQVADLIARNPKSAKRIEETLRRQRARRAGRTIEASTPK